MIRCDNCGTNNMDGSEYCDECGMRLDQPSPRRSHRHEAVPIYQPPSAVDSSPPRSNTIDGPMPAPPSFTTSTSIPKPAMPARERKSGGDSRSSAPNARRSQTNERSGSAFKSNKRRADHSLPPPSLETFALSSAPQTDELDSDSASLVEIDGARALARLIIERGGRIGREFPII